MLRDHGGQGERDGASEPSVFNADVVGVLIPDALVNILSNAVRFTNDGGTLRFETPDHPGADSQHIVVRCVVSDNGRGSAEMDGRASDGRVDFDAMKGQYKQKEGMMRIRHHALAHI